MKFYQRLTFFNLMPLNVVDIKFSNDDSQSWIRCYTAFSARIITVNTMSSGKYPLSIKKRSATKNKVICESLEPNLPRPVSIGGYLTSNNTTQLFWAATRFCKKTKTAFRWGNLDRDKSSMPRSEPSNPHEWPAIQYHSWIQHQGYKNKGSDHQLKKLLIVK